VEVEAPGGRSLRRIAVGALAALLVLAVCTTTPRPGAAASPMQLFYFHGAAPPSDDVNRAASSPSATFDSEAPTGSSDSLQTGVVDANPSLDENPLSVYWVGTAFKGRINGTMHFDWYWSTLNPETVALGTHATVTIYGDGVQIGQGHVALAPGTSATLIHSDVKDVVGSVAAELVVEVTMDDVDSGNAVTAHYNSTAAPSSFEVPIDTRPLPPATPRPLPTCSGTFCFRPAVVLPESSKTGSASDTCASPCGEPSLAVSPTDGTMYVSTPRTILLCCNSQASPVWTSSNDGATWSEPIFPSAPESATTGGDTELAIDKRGTVYEGELWLGSDSIYISSDTGRTWSWSPASHDVLDDREWFVYSPMEDALYGYYDGIKGLMVVKAPLTTPLGTSAAMFFPQEVIAVPEWIDCPGLIAGPCVEKPGPLPDSVNGIPILQGDTSPGRPSVSPVDGTLYFPFPYQVAGKGVGLAVTNDGLTFSYRYVTGSGHGVFGDTHNDFPVTAVDAAGRLYVAWIEDKGDGLNLYLSSSPDKGSSWTKPLEVSKGISRTAVFPNVVAGAAGQVAVSWYGTPTKGDPNDGNDPAKDTKSVKQATWNVYVSEVLGAGTAHPVAVPTSLENHFHTGVICTMGTSCSGDGRKLLDFFDMQLDRQGHLGVVYTRDVGASKTEIAFSRQASGCLLTAPCAITRNAAATSGSGQGSPPRSGIIPPVPISTPNTSAPPPASALGVAAAVLIGAAAATRRRARRARTARSAPTPLPDSGRSGKGQR
jgi:hypothetical protein